MKALYFLILFTLSIFAESHGVSKRITTDFFNKIDINIPADVIVNKKSKKRVLLETDSRTIKKIKIYTKGKTLYIRAKSSFKSTKGITITISNPHLIALIIDGSSTISVNGYSEDRFSLLLDGASDVSFSRGGFNNFLLKADGSFDINLLNIKIKNAKIRADGAGDIKINVNKHLDIKLKGSVDTKVLGHPKIKKEIKDVSELTHI